MSMRRRPFRRIAVLAATLVAVSAFSASAPALANELYWEGPYGTQQVCQEVAQEYREAGYPIVSGCYYRDLPVLPGWYFRHSDLP